MTGMGLLTWCIHEDRGQGTTKTDNKRQEWEYLLGAFIKMGDKVPQRQTIKDRNGITYLVHSLRWGTRYHKDGQ